MSYAQSQAAPKNAPDILSKTQKPGEIYMKFSYAACGSLIFFLTLLCVQNVEAGFSNSGRMQSKNLNLSIGGTLDNNGELNGSETATLSCETLSGKGLIKSPQISIKTKIFAYTGTIECSETCTIVASKSFDESMFKRKGNGEFVIIIEEKNDKKNTAPSGSYDITDQLLLQVE
ncbi:MAG: hypothetical protein LLG04_03545 [Parachlamydia sp.]|nr:hypothetical protein [Parachlamydia sp.]